MLRVWRTVLLQGMAWRGCDLFILLSGVTALFVTADAQAADEFAPPQVERDVVAAVGKGGGRITVDGEYRVIGATLGAEGTNDDLKALASCERVTTISFTNAKITDEGLAHLKELKKLTSISINSNGPTDAGIAALRAALPECRITSFGRAAAAPGGRPAFGQPAAGGGPGSRSSGGPGGGFGGTLGTSRTVTLLRNAAVQDDLNLSPEQKTQVATASNNAAISEVMKLLDEKVLAVLTAEQKARVKQLELQQNAASILRADIVAQLKLAEEQVAAITKVNEEQAAVSQTALRDLFAQRGNETTEAILAKAREKAAEFNKQRDEKVQAVLNEEQKKAWKELIGPPGPVLSSTFTPSASRFGGGGPAQTPAAAAKVVFDRYDTNRDNQLSDTEFPENNRTREALKTAGITLVYPVAREVFETNYAKYYEQNRRGR